MLIYKEYVGSIEFSKDDDCFFGKVLGLDGNLVSYEGASIKELEDDFKAAIDCYMTSCRERYIEPITPTVSPRLAQSISKIESEEQYYSCLSRIEELLNSKDASAYDETELKYLSDIIHEYDI